MSNNYLAPLLLTAEQAGAICGVSVQTWRRYDSAGRTPAPVRLSRGSIRWKAEEIRDWIEAGAPDRKTWAASRRDTR